MIRPTTPADTQTLIDLTADTGMFLPRDLHALQEVLDDYYAENQALGHRAVALEEDGQLLGYAYYAPAAMTDRTWYLWWIVVAKTTQGRGLGGQLLRHVEDDARAQGGRLLMIETSSVPAYELTRKFYLRHQYDQEALLRDYYADGDGMVIFRKRLAP
jgi:GNAT superfamily N-acetyltransferase